MGWSGFWEVIEEESGLGAPAGDENITTWARGCRKVERVKRSPCDRGRKASERSEVARMLSRNRT